jgi:hypothetical protein
MSDSTVYNQSATSADSDKPFAYKGWEYINDSNALNYSSGQVSISTESIANNGNFINLREGVLKVPLILTLTGTKGAGAGTAIDWSTIKGEYMAALKSGYWNTLASMNVAITTNIIS